MGQLSKSDLISLVARMCEDAEEYYRETLKEEGTNKEAFECFCLFSAVITRMILANAVSIRGSIEDDVPYGHLRMWERMDLPERKKLVQDLFSTFQVVTTDHVENRLKVLRGGPWRDNPINCRSSDRSGAGRDRCGDVSFRAVCVPRTPR